MEHTKIDPARLKWLRDFSAQHEKSPARLHAVIEEILNDRDYHALEHARYRDMYRSTLDARSSEK